ncbi:ganglioside GM2 activator-like [Glandiceps talaboti]
MYCRSLPRVTVTIFLAFHLGFSNGFSWKQCGGDAIEVNVLSIKPDPIQIPGDVFLNYDIDVTKLIGQPITLKLEMKRLIKIGPVTTEIDIPCIVNGTTQIGSCTYDDVCSLLNIPCSAKLWASPYNFPCTCPPPVGNYAANDIMVTIPSVPDNYAGLLEGDYRIIVNVMHGDGTSAGCIDINASLSTS